jgi:prolyl-tRNA editing enzyme YbaK/EbsC (Cys-tRNA(Pro) deacylase)
MEGVLEKAAVQRAQAALSHHQMPGQIKVLSDSARTAAEAAAALGIEVGQIASSIVFKLPEDRVDTHIVAHLLNVEKLGRADADYVKEVSGYSVGGVAPVGWINSPATILLDEALNDYDIVWAAAGHPHAVFPTSFAELLKATGATPARVGD